MLDDVLRAVSSGERAVLMLSGEPGIGKTRLLEQLVTRVIAAGGCVAWGRMWEVGAHAAVLAVHSAARCPGASRAIARPRSAPSKSRGDAAARLARFGEVVGVPRRGARAHGPSRILLDDLHAADPASLAVARVRAAAAWSGTRVLFALAARDSDAQPRSRDARWAASSAAHGGCRSRGSDRPKSRSWSAVRADGHRVFELSDGNPLFVEELVASARADGSLRLPALSSVRAVIRDRVAAPARGRAPRACSRPRSSAAISAGQVVADMLGERRCWARCSQPAQSAGDARDDQPDQLPVLPRARRRSDRRRDRTRRSERGCTLRAARAMERLRARRHLRDRTPPARGRASRGRSRSGRGRARRGDCMAQLAFENAAALLDRALAALRLRRRRTTTGARALAVCARRSAAAREPARRGGCNCAIEAAAIVRALGADGGRGRSSCSPASRSCAGSSSASARPTRAWSRCCAKRSRHSTAFARQHARRRRGAALRAKLLARLAAAEQPAPRPARTHRARARGHRARETRSRRAIAWT